MDSLAAALISGRSAVTDGDSVYRQCVPSVKTLSKQVRLYKTVHSYRNKRIRSLIVAIGTQGFDP